MGKPILTIFYQFNPWQFTNWWYSKTVLRQLVPCQNWAEQAFWLWNHKQYGRFHNLKNSEEIVS